VNPEVLNIAFYGWSEITLKPLNIKNLDEMFVHSFANYFRDEFPCVIFAGVGRDEHKIFIVTACTSEAEHGEFLAKLRENPYIEEISTQYLSTIVKGQRLLPFNEDWFAPSEDQTDDEEPEDEEDDLERTIEVILD
jgi:hypothetical protein